MCTVVATLEARHRGKAFGRHGHPHCHRSDDPRDLELRQNRTEVVSDALRPGPYTHFAPGLA